MFQALPKKQHQTAYLSASLPFEELFHGCGPRPGTGRYPRKRKAQPLSTPEEDSAEIQPAM